LFSSSLAAAGMAWWSCKHAAPLGQGDKCSSILQSFGSAGAGATRYKNILLRGARTGASPLEPSND